MFIEQNKLKRQSQLLLQNSGADEQLMKALDENAKLNQILEEERLQHQQKVRIVLPSVYAVLGLGSEPTYWSKANISLTWSRHTDMKSEGYKSVVIDKSHLFQWSPYVRFNPMSQDDEYLPCTISR